MDISTFASLVITNPGSFTKRIKSSVVPLFLRYIRGLREIPLHQGLHFEPVWSSVPTRAGVKSQFRRIWDLKFGKGHPIHKLYQNIPSMACIGLESSYLAAHLERFGMAYGRMHNDSIASLVPKYTRFALDEHNKYVNVLTTREFNGLLGFVTSKRTLLSCMYLDRLWRI